MDNGGADDYRAGLFGVGVVNGQLYAVGGNDCSGQSLSSVERFDPAENKWIVVAPMTTARACCGVGVVDGRLYAVGGFGGFSSWR